MPDPRALMLLEQLNDLGKELSADGDVTVDDLLAESLENGAYEEDLLNEAIAIRLEQLGIAETPAEKAHRDDRWAALTKHEKRRTSSRKLSHIVRIAAVVLVGAIALSGLTVGAAYAFNWELILRVFQPVAETLGLDLNSTSRDADIYRDAGQMVNDDGINYQTELAPAVLWGYPVKLVWVPKGYEFEYWFVFEGTDMRFMTSQYKNDVGKELLFKTTVFSNEDTVGIFSLEKNTMTGEVYVIAGHEVVLMTNNNVTNATWSDGYAFYELKGKVSKEDVEQIVMSLYGG